MSKIDSIAYPPRGLSREEAARYIGVGTSTFDRLVAERRMPKPLRVGKRVIWDRLKVEAAFAELDEDAGENSIDRALRTSHQPRSGGNVHLTHRLVKEFDPSHPKQEASGRLGWTLPSLLPVIKKIRDEPD